ncbi:hypothetical protein PENARI_c056G12104 [Penicillium arizonense]|uniref:Cytochrome P450 monooxygenase n=1 Tax=Penicillium arizonense TaxID=1835702 RepID=A0A1F5L1W5_PENAI|nr:hypothetical protein PENARI_c056G12104 [Penicillium arizonense]OGE47195.1 hypothetical protein PENARI_c056G12104 [Penicillium arizonense]
MFSGLMGIVLGSDLFYLPLVLALVICLYLLGRSPRLYPGLPVVNVDPRFAGCFQVFTESGPKIVLPGRFADEIRNHPALNFREGIAKEFFGSYPGFNPFAADNTARIVTETTRGKLTQSLNLITEELVDETSSAVEELFGVPEAWTEITYKPKIVQLVARVSSRVFLGQELSANEDWIRLSTDYAVDAMVAARKLREWHFCLRPIVHWFLPECRKIRKRMVEARKIIMPVVERRRKINHQAREAGQPISKVADTVGWMDAVANGRKYDIVTAQLGLAFASIFTTADMISGLIGDLCANPEYFKPLLEEISSVLGDKGWSKRALQELKLMDSAMKESQRHHVGDIATMRRLTKEPVTLSDGTFIPKGAFTMVGLDMLYDSKIFNAPHQFKGSRFLEMRQQSGQDTRWRFVTTSPEHLAFGHGNHACPGRFFAASEIKVILVYLLMNYDWKLTSEGRPNDLAFGQETETNPTAKAMIKKRKQDIALPDKGTREPQKM